MATIIFYPDSPDTLPSISNTLSINGRRCFLFDINMFTHYKIDAGDCTLNVVSPNGSNWEISTYVGYSDCLNVKFITDDDGNIADVLYMVDQEPPTAMFAKKLP